jgi:ribose transport system substrate-binding protein
MRHLGKITGALAAALLATSLYSVPALADPDSALAELQKTVLSKGPMVKTRRPPPRSR